MTDEEDEDMLIRVWGSDDWIEPTVDIYERDCERNDKKMAKDCH